MASGGHQAPYKLLALIPFQVAGGRITAPLGQGRIDQRAHVRFLDDVGCRRNPDLGIELAHLVDQLRRQHSVAFRRITQAGMHSDFCQLTGGSLFHQFQYMGQDHGVGEAVWHAVFCTEIV